jgi:hypothetical protein
VRNDALLNGALIALGAAAILDNVLSHWLLGLHRAVPGELATPVEVALAVLGGGAVLVGVGRERRASRSARHRQFPPSSATRMSCARFATVRSAPTWSVETQTPRRS